ncbi:MAG: hypothetical protein HQL64_09610 [Magnetococcales bacterium]|nr:hypothetical protein [Magnetococcales bacterium]
MKGIVIKLLGMTLGALVAATGFSGPALAKGEPIMMLIQVAGPVEYSKDGAQWNPITQNKMLFEGTQVRSGAGGSGKLINQVSGTEQELGADTVIKVSATGVELVSGKGLTEGKAGDSGLMSDVKNRFAKAERYTTVRRSVDKDAAVEKVDVAKEITLSSAHPDLVWENKGPDYAYELVIDDKKVAIPASKDAIVRHKVAGVTPGQHKYQVALLKGGKVISKDDNSGTFTWMSPAEEEALKKEVAANEKKYPGNLFVLGSLLEKNNLTVAAMETYQKYLAKNGDDNDFRPFLIKTLQDLKLGEMKKAEVQKYNGQVGKP